MWQVRACERAHILNFASVSAEIYIYGVSLFVFASVLSERAEWTCVLYVACVFVVSARVCVVSVCVRTFLSTYGFFVSCCWR